MPLLTQLLLPVLLILEVTCQEDDQEKFMEVPLCGGEYDCGGGACISVNREGALTPEETCPDGDTCFCQEVMEVPLCGGEYDCGGGRCMSVNREEALTPEEICPDGDTCFCTLGDETETTAAQTTSAETPLQTTSAETTSAQTTSAETPLQTTSAETTATPATAAETTAAQTTAAETTAAQTTAAETTAAAPAGVAAVIKGTLTLSMKNPEAFLKDEVAQDAAKTMVATLAGVPKEYVSVRVEVQQRRLQDADDDQPVKLTIAYDITLPMMEDRVGIDGGAPANVYDIQARVEAVEKEDVQRVISLALAEVMDPEEVAALDIQVEEIPDIVVSKVDMSSEPEPSTTDEFSEVVENTMDPDNLSVAAPKAVDMVLVVVAVVAALTTFVQH